MSAGLETVTATGPALPATPLPVGAVGVNGVAANPAGGPHAPTAGPARTTVSDADSASAGPSADV
ncbi:hypothetical protein, partial [Streptomyces sp. NPDC005345]|uniref:hypothetical protein n=1 Tax=Streptomyces sp. NPDC005345 TaxID=3156877 RepID=UPI0033A0095B